MRGAAAPTPWAAVWEWLARAAHYRAVRTLRVAAESGDAERLVSLLHPGVAVVVDSGEPGHPTNRVVGGVYDAITLLLHGMEAQPGLVIAERSVNGQAGLMLSRDGETTATVTVDFAGPLISLVWIRLHPETRRHWNTV